MPVTLLLCLISLCTTVIQASNPHSSQLAPGRNLNSHDWTGGSDLFVKLAYSGSSYRSRTAQSSGQKPLWGDTFVLSEDQSLLARRISLEVGGWVGGPSLGVTRLT